MKKEELLKEIQTIFSKIFKDNGIEFVDVEYVKEPKGNVLRIFIDKKDGVDLDSCEFASNLVSEWLDEVDPIEQSYFLEVSSPGIDREIKLDKLENFIDKKILIKCYKKINGTKEFIGYLKGYDDVKLTLDIDKQSIDFDKNDIAIIKTQN